MAGLYIDHIIAIIPLIIVVISMDSNVNDVIVDYDCYWSPNRSDFGESLVKM